MARRGRWPMSRSNERRSPKQADGLGFRLYTAPVGAIAKSVVSGTAWIRPDPIPTASPSRRFGRVGRFAWLMEVRSRRPRRG